MEELTKTQLILMALLVSFVTSIATGIATVSLLERAPADITRVIDRVVERTIETITTKEGSVIEKTIVVKEDDLITNSVAQIASSLVRLYQDGSDGSDFLGLGFVVSTDGHVLTSAGLVTDGGVYTLRLADGERVESVVVSQDEVSGTALLEAVGVTSETKFNPVVFGDAESARLGQGIIVVSGEENNVSTGIISNIRRSTLEDSDKITSIRTTIAPAAALIGTPLSNLFGEIIGLKVSPESDRFLPVGLPADL